MDENFVIHKVEMSGTEMEKASHRMREAINTTQKIDGYTFEETLVVMMWVLGACLKHHKILLEIDLPVKEALSPVVRGYQAQGKIHEH